MFSLFLHAAPETEELLSAELWECGTSGIVEDPGGLRAFFEAADQQALLDRFAAYSPELREEQSTDWEKASRDAWPAVLVGGRFFLVPPWSEEATPAGRLRLEIHPGMACGTGRHPATQLCLTAIERYVRPEHTVLDIGAGSGILSAASMLMGAAQVAGCDIDADNVAIARERVGSRLFVGSTGAIGDACADVVIANIDGPTLEDLAPELARIGKPACTFILSGFTAAEMPEGFKAREILQQDEWRCMVC